MTAFKKQISPRPTEDTVSPESTATVTPVDLSLEEDDYVSREDDWVRYYKRQIEIMPGVEVDAGVFVVFLNEQKTSALQFREPNTGEYLTMLGKQKQNPKDKDKLTVKPTDNVLNFIATLSCSEFQVTSGFLKRLPVKYQYRIIRTLSWVMGTVAEPEPSPDEDLEE